MFCCRMSPGRTKDIPNNLCSSPEVSRERIRTKETTRRRQLLCYDDCEPTTTFRRWKEDELTKTRVKLNNIRRPESTKMAAASTSRSTLHALYRANLGILRQKLGLLDAIKDQFGPTQAQELFKQTCPVVNASIGQHLRHSMDHIEIAAQAAVAKVKVKAPSRPASAAPSQEVVELHYDLRQRGGNDETELEEAEARIKRVQQILLDGIDDGDSEEEEDDDADADNEKCSINAYFMLSGDYNDEFELPTSVPRELGFACHHGIHHLAMIKVIASQTLKLDLGLLPDDFGKAPSTIVFESSTSSSSD